MKSPICFLVIIITITSSSFCQSNKSKFSRMDIFHLEYTGDPQISPDGNKVVYVRSGMDIMRDRKKFRLWIINADGSNHRKLTTREVDESSPRWSPTGDRILFSSNSEEGREIFVYWISSGQIAQLSQLERSPGGLSWSPDGTQVAFSMLVPESPPVLVKPPKKPKGAEWPEIPRITTRLKHEADGSGYLETGFRHFFVIPS